MGKQKNKLDPERCVTGYGGRVRGHSVCTVR
jgi:hypothetical protein